MIDLPERDLAIVQAVLRAHLPPNGRAYVFGSRATGGARRYSDLDLALEGEQKLGFEIVGAVAEALSQSELAIKVDVVDLLAVEPRFRRLIQAELVPLAF